LGRFRRRFLPGVLVLAGLGLAGCHTAGRGDVRENHKDNLLYVFIPSGTFEMGCSKLDEDCKPDEKPAHTVTISKGFWIGQTEVTVEAYRRFATTTHRPMPPEPEFGSRSLNPGWSDPRQPIVNVDWDDARSYCEWIGGHLPTEAQWEYAARGGATTSRYGDLPAIAWFGDNAGKQRIDAAKLFQEDGPGYLGHLSMNGNTPHRVGLLTPNPYGLYDVLGNEWEWTSDWYGASYYQGSQRFDPTGQPSGDARVLRGGSWVDLPAGIRVSVRGHRPPSARSVDTGFRCEQ
jgi:formylglycine-generating enzyme required for sulfatase activity